MAAVSRAEAWFAGSDNAGSVGVLMRAANGSN
jgi:hypothetical protein